MPVKSAPMKNTATVQWTTRVERPVADDLIPTSTSSRSRATWMAWARRSRSRRHPELAHTSPPVSFEVSSASWGRRP